MDYKDLVKNAVVYMEENICNDICLEDISDCVNLSFFHFHRIFSAYSGYSLKEYLRKRRLSESARSIIFTRLSLKEIARHYRFDTYEHFVRAFRKEFNISPGNLRKQNTRFAYFPPYSEEIYLKIIQKKGNTQMDPIIMEKPEFKIVGLKCTTTMSENTIPRLWEDFNKRCCEVKNGQDLWLGVCPYVEMDSFGDDVPFDYIAGRAVNNFESIPEGMMTWTVPASKYAIFTHKGSLDTLNETYKYIFCIWANKTEYKIAKADQIELYDERFKFGQADSEFDIYIPIV